jgi:hypothetical protein
MLILFMARNSCTATVNMVKVHTLHFPGGFREFAWLTLYILIHLCLHM